jgi:hypothetical protein
LEGPITDQLQLHAEFGGYFSGNGHDGFLWLLSLRHQAGPYTEESLTFSRSLNAFYDEVIQGVGYNIRQVFGPKIIGEAFIWANNVYDLNGNTGYSYDELRTGVRFSIRAGPRTTFKLTGTYALIETDRGNSSTWTGLAEVDHYFTDTLLGRLIYQYQQNDSAFFNDSYYENLIYLSLTKYFN